MKRVLLLSLALFLLLAIQGEALEIRYLGHSAFFLSFESGFRCILDPFAPQVGYRIPEGLAVDALVSSHEHFDHFFDGFAESTQIFVGTKNKGAEWNLFDATIKGVHVFALPSYHDDAQGKLRGKNAILVLEGEGMRLAHLGDIGAIPEKEVAEKLKDVDILFVPTGGHYTLPPDRIVKLIEDLTPRVVVPMHYRTEVTKDWPIAPLEEFLREVKEWKVKTLDSPLVLKKEDLPETLEIWVMRVWTE